LMPRSKQILIG